MQANKYYVVWKGFAPGIYDSWEEAEIQIKDFKGASYRSFKTIEAATEAFREGYDKTGLIKEMEREMKRLQEEGVKIEWNDTLPGAAPEAEAATGNSKYITDAISVDAACPSSPGPIEYRGVWIKNRQELFRFGPMEGGNNNIGEFLAVVHCLAMQEQQGTRYPIYSDSVTALSWVKGGICRTSVTENDDNHQLFDIIRRAETWLRTHSFRVPIYKWDTKNWGEIPADFGRK